MAEVVASSLVKMVCEKIGSKLMKEYDFLSGSRKELKKLEGTLMTIREVLEDAEARQEKEKTLRGWLRQLKDVAFEIDDLLDDAELETVKSFGKVCKLLSFPNSIKFKSTIAHKAMEIRKKVDETAAERSKFHLQEKTESNREGSISRESSSFVIESEGFGREQDKESIIDFLIHKENETGVGVMVIVGMGGLGKTTIAQLVYNDKRVSDHFDNLIWVSINDNFDIRRITSIILESITERKYDFNLELRQRKLKERIRGQRFLLVLDDVWNENGEKWDQLRALLTVGEHGSKVIVTTRSTRVATIMGTVNPYILTGISKEDCWLLFERRAFTLGTRNVNSNLVNIGKHIVLKCGGVPLAAKVLGSLMQFKRKESEWLAVREDDIWNLSKVENEILPSLRLSYISLPSHLKQCFSYCALFRKGKNIWIFDLIQLWIAEGFIRSCDSRAKLEDVGKEYVEELLSRSLFQTCSTHDGETFGYIKMHDLIHDLANYVSVEECSIADTVGITNAGENVRYSSLVCKNATLSSNLKSSRIPIKLRTLYVIPQGSQVQEQQNVFLNDICSNFTLLRALHLRNYPLKELPNSLRNLRHLRYLNLSYTSLKILSSHIIYLYNLRTLNLAHCYYLEKLSDSIGELCNLIILDLSNCTRLCLTDSIGHLRSLEELDLTRCAMGSLPMSIVKLTNLKSLRLRSCCYLRELPSRIREMRSLVHLDVDKWLECIPCGIGDLCHLRSMPFFVPGGKTQCSIRELGALDLKDKLHIKCLENVKTPQEAKEAKLILKNDLRELCLSWNLKSYINRKENSIDTEEGKSITNPIEKQEYSVNMPLVEQILENLQPPDMLSHLVIKEFPGKILPKWVRVSQLPNLVHIALVKCIKCEILPEFKKFECLKVLILGMLTEVRSLNCLGQVPSLEVLYIVYLPLVQCLVAEFYGGDVAFTRLEYLELKSMPELEEWYEVALGFEFFPRLAALIISTCPKLKKIPSNFSTIRSLKVTVDDKVLLSSLTKVF